MEEAPRLALRALPRLRARQHVIGRREDLGGPPGAGRSARKGWMRGKVGSAAAMIGGAGLFGEVAECNDPCDPWSL